MDGSRFGRRCVALAGSLAVAGLGNAHAQDDHAELEILKKKVAELEAKQAKDPVADAMSWKEFQKLGTKWTLSGWLRLDSQYNDSRMSSDQIPQWVLSEDPDTALTATSRAKRNSSEFTMHPKLTRLWLDMDGPKVKGLADAKLSGKLELDFYNSTATESRQALRIRVAWLRMQWGDWNFYGGQMWDLIAPLNPAVNNDMLMWNAGNLADRRPQMRVDYTPTTGDWRWSFAGMVGQTGAIDAQDNDATGSGKGIRDGDQSGLPTLQARIGAKTTLDKETKDLELGAWAHHASEETDKPVGGSRNFVSGVYGIDAIVPVWKKTIWVQGELWHGRNADDVRGGIGQGVNTTTGQEIRSEGGWGEVGWQLAPSCALFAGGTFDNPNNADLAKGARDRNSTRYAAVRWNFDPVSFGVEWIHWVTGYARFDDGTANRFAAYVQYKF